MVKNRICILLLKSHVTISFIFYTLLLLTHMSSAVRIYAENLGRLINMSDKFNYNVNDKCNYNTESMTIIIEITSKQIKYICKILQKIIYIQIFNTV